MELFYIPKPTLMRQDTATLYDEMRNRNRKLWNESDHTLSIEVRV
jgi:hypothetical protein